MVTVRVKVGVLLAGGEVVQYRRAKYLTFSSKLSL